VSRVIAALDNSFAAGPVLATARNLARLFDASIDAVHVREDGARIAESVAGAAGLSLRVLEGPTVEALVEAAEAEDVVALVVGARRTPAGARPVGATALELVSSLPKPVVVVPPDIAPGALKRVLVPLEGTRSTSLTARSIVRLARGAHVDVIVLHVHDEETLPAFTDQPQHESAAWEQEFLDRFCPWGLGEALVEVRAGRPEDQIALAAQENAADLIALGWSQELAAGRAPVVRAVLERGHIPILLLPVFVTSDTVVGDEPEGFLDVAMLERLKSRSKPQAAHQR
jgi:nucleotide-binding universal stress UspA family protein